jgi:hypothetical protein
LLSTAPGLNWEYGIEVSSFGPEWALVPAYQDAGEDQAAAFPWILGFAAQNDFPWSVAAVLAEEPYGTPEPTELYSSGWSGWGPVSWSCAGQHSEFDKASLNMNSSRVQILERRNFLGLQMHPSRFGVAHELRPRQTERVACLDKTRAVLLCEFRTAAASP